MTRQFSQASVLLTFYFPLLQVRILPPTLRGRFWCYSALTHIRCLGDHCGYYWLIPYRLVCVLTNSDLTPDLVYCVQWIIVGVNEWLNIEWIVYYYRSGIVTPVFDGVLVWTIVVLFVDQAWWRTPVSSVRLPPPDVTPFCRYCRTVSNDELIINQRILPWQRWPTFQFRQFPIITDDEDYYLMARRPLLRTLWPLDQLFKAFGITRPTDLQPW